MTNWDNTQRRIIELGQEVHQIVDAGPGTGKTAVACARVAYLIETCDLEATNILLISFTRTAIKEIKDRITAFAQNELNIAGLQILTLDSFTWQMLRGFDDKSKQKLLESYDNNIQNFITRLKSGDSGIREYLANLEHVIIDESQDLVGTRAELAIQLINNLPEECGVTVFSDSAQAIYGFTNDKDENDLTFASKSLVDRLKEEKCEGFSFDELTEIHRTQDEKLKNLFTNGRNKILVHDQKKNSPDNNIEHWKDIRNYIIECAHENIAILKDKNHKTIQLQEQQGSRSLILFRTRGEVLNQSSFFWSEGIHHKIRMSGIPVRIHPWIGRIFSEFTENTCSHQQFQELWSSRIGYNPPTLVPSEEQAWELLLDNVGDKYSRIKMPDLRRLLSNERPPIDFLVDENELPGPIIGTIHASKGREASIVYLMLKHENYLESFNNPTDQEITSQINEEARVLFVGATRAKEKLIVGKGFHWSGKQLNKRRAYAQLSSPAASKVEIGLQGDLDLPLLVNVSMMSASQNPADLQTWLWTHSSRHCPVHSKYNFNKKAQILYSNEEPDKPIAVMSKGFTNDLWEISKQVGNNLTLPPEIKYIHMFGSSTVVIPEKERENLLAPWNQSGFMLAPYITGFPPVYFKFKNFPKVKRRKK